MKIPRLLFFGILATLLPVLLGLLMWRYLDRCFGPNDEAHINSLDYFLKKTKRNRIKRFCPSVDWDKPRI